MIVAKNELVLGLLKKEDFYRIFNDRKNSLEYVFF